MAAVDDRVMLIVVGELLDHPDEYSPKPEVLRELLARLRERLEREAAKRPKHRPKEDDTGALVATMHEYGNVSLARAKYLAAKMKRKKVRTVARSYERHQNRKRQK